MGLSLTDIEWLLRERGEWRYGREPVNQLQHALQCAHLAQVAGESVESVAAALLHDLGHLMAMPDADLVESEWSEDDEHQLLLLPQLHGVFSDDVLEPIRLHVDAKRYLCLIEPSYWNVLSPESQRGLALQGGVFSEAEADAFIHRPFAAEAVRLRRYDDLAKVPGKVVPTLDHFLGVLEHVALARQ